MKIRHEETYAILPAILFAVFTDRDFYDARYSSAKGKVDYLEFGPRGGRFVIDVKQHVALAPGASIPSFARRFVRDVNVLHTRMEWDLSKGDAHRGTHKFRIEGVPVDIAGHMHLEPCEEGVRNRVELTISCSIPLVGGKIAEMLGERARKSLVKNEVTTRNYLQAKGLLPGA